MNRRWFGILVAIVVVGGCGSTSSTSIATIQTAAASSTAVSTPAPTPVSVAPSPSGTSVPIASPTCPDCTPLSAGKHTTVAFLPGMVLTMPDGWLLGEDSSGELKLNPADDLGLKLSFFTDPIAVTNDTNIVAGVDGTPTALVAWLRSNPNLSVSKPTTTTIGQGVSATSVDLTVASGAKSGDPGCPPGLACVNLFLFRGSSYKFGYAISSDQGLRFTFAQIGSGSAARTLFVLHEVVPPDSLTDFATRTKPIIASLRLP